MLNENQEPVHQNNILGVLVGLLVGGLTGAFAMLLLAPKSGKDTRMQIREKGIELRDRANGVMEDVMAQMRSDRSRLTMTGRQKARELFHQGQDLVVEQLDHVSDAAQAGKKAIQASQG
jgi:gas vesicle protein